MMLLICDNAVLLKLLPYFCQQITLVMQTAHNMFIIIIIISVFCPRAGPSLQVQEPRLQFCPRQVIHCKLRNQGCSFTRDWIGVVASHCFLHPTLSLASEQTLKIWKFPGAVTWWWGEWIWLTGPTGLHQNSPQRLNISSIRVLDQIRDPEIPITLFHHNMLDYGKYVIKSLLYMFSYLTQIRLNIDFSK